MGPDRRVGVGCGWVVVGVVRSGWGRVVGVVRSWVLIGRLGFRNWVLIDTLTSGLFQIHHAAQRIRFSHCRGAIADGVDR